MTSNAAYRKWHLPVQPQPHFLVESLLRAGALRDYFLYRDRSETGIAADWLARVSVSPDRIYLERAGMPPWSEPARDPFKQVEHMLESLPYSGWTAYGYIAFDMARFYHPYAWSFGSPLLQFIIPRFELQIADNAVSILGEDLGAGELDAIADLIAHPRSGISHSPTSLALVDTDRLEFCDKVTTLTAGIRAGALQKAILSRCVRVSGILDLLGTYATASQVNNASRSYCFKLDDVGAVGFSPEVLLESNGHGLVTTNPLAGTRPRGATAREDERIRAELFTDPKEVKEHALSVLLAQEEIGSVCSADSVRIHDFMAVSAFRCVQHLSSRVSGRLCTGNTSWDALKVLFPGVTVAGIPKASALQWISDLESEPRGIYSGAVGWVDSSGRADLALALRSAFQYGDTIHLNAGAGIVAESVPENEYIESVNKMNTMISQLVLRAAQGSSKVAHGLR